MTEPNKVEFAKKEILRVCKDFDHHGLLFFIPSLAGLLGLALETVILACDELNGQDLSDRPGCRLLFKNGDELWLDKDKPDYGYVLKKVSDAYHSGKAANGRGDLFEMW